jgi:hypothetical protein
MPGIACCIACVSECQRSIEVVQMAGGALAVAGVAAWLLWKRRTVCRQQLPRVYELRDLLPNPPPPGAYFADFDRSLADIPQKLKQFRDIERDLQGLDQPAWGALKTELAPLMAVRDPKRGWRPLFDILDHAKAYNYLKRIGYTHVEFIPRATVKGQATPDLRGASPSGAALCEVKTINVSEDEATRRSVAGVGRVALELGTGFFNKLSALLTQARKQMQAYDPSPNVERIV